jgi:hypothetical protein
MKQVAGKDYDDTYAPVASWETVHMLLSLSLKNNWKTQQLDYVLAFPQAGLNDGRVSQEDARSTPTDRPKATIFRSFTFRLTILQKSNEISKSTLSAFAHSLE